MTAPLDRTTADNATPREKNATARPPTGPVTLLRDAAIVVTLDDAATVHRDTSVLIVGDAIAAIGTRADLADRATAAGATIVEASNHLVMPGFVNLHTHLSMTLLRGLAEDVDLAGFLTRVFAAEGAVMDPETVHLGAELGALEALRSGTTTALDMYLHPAHTRAGAVRLGLRHATGPVFFDSPGPDGIDWDTRMSLLAAWSETASALGGPLAPNVASPHSTYLVSPTHLAEIREALRAWNTPVLHTHVSETLAENAEVYAGHASTPTRMLADAGILDGSFPVVFGHGIHLDDTDVRLAAEANVTIAHCPGSNLKLASGALSWSKMRAAGVRLGIGTDGCSSSNDLDMWSAVRLSALLSRLTTDRPDATTAYEILRAATVSGAEALGIGHLVGTIEVGKQADLVLLDLDAPHLTPVHDVHALLVFAAGRGDVTDVFVAGERVIADRTSTRVDTPELLARARERAVTAREAASAAISGGPS